MELLALVHAHPYASTAVAAILALKLPLPKLPNLVEAFFKAAFGAALGWVFPTYYVDNDGSSYVVSFLEHNSRSFGPTQHQFSNSREFIRPLGRVGTVWGTVVNSRSRLFWFCGRPIWYCPPQSKPGGSGTEKPYYRVLRGTVRWERLLELAAQYADRKIMEHADGVSMHKIVNCVGSKRGGNEDTSATSTKAAPPPDIMGATIRRLLHWKQEELGWPPGQQEMDVLSFTPSMERVVRDVGFFVRNRKWYEDRQIPWRRGYLLYGSPGTGKTSLVRALAEQLDVPIYIFNLATMDDHDFLKAWAATRSDYRKIILLEDFDTIFHGRENVSKTRCTLSFQTVLNCIDGIERNHGMMLFITTNEVDKIDQAIGAPDGLGDSTRPGRIDLIAHMEGMNLEGRLKIARRVFRDDAKAREFASEERGESASQFTGRCIMEAQRELWATYDGGHAPAPVAKTEDQREGIALEQESKLTVSEAKDYDLGPAVPPPFDGPTSAGSL